MSQHVASQILAAVESRLSAIAPVYIVPLSSIPIDNLPAIVIENIEDETVSQIGRGPLAEKHQLRFEVFGAVVATGGFQVFAGQLRTGIEQALLGTPSAIVLDGLSRPGLKRTAADFRHDAESLQKPVGGWSMKFECVYQLSTDAPDVAI